MSSQSEPTASWSPIEALSRWWRTWTESQATDLRCCAEDDVARIAKDVGLSVGELRLLASRGPESADLLLQRMAALDLDQKEVSELVPRTFQDLQRVCTLCESKRRCARDMARDPAASEWKDYCPNAATLMALNAQPWTSRHEW